VTPSATLEGLKAIAHSLDSQPERPLLRGVLHEIGLGAALVVGTLLIATADGGLPLVAA
jgi:hypothetical protein